MEDDTLDLEGLDEEMMEDVYSDLLQSHDCHALDLFMLGL